MTHLDGALAQLGERYNGIVEVRGSNPLGSTISRFAARNSANALNGNIKPAVPASGFGW